MARTALVDYGAGNLGSVARALEHLGAPFEICDSGDRVAGADRVVLPGVGSFGAAARQLDERGLRAPVLEAIRGGVPFLGICLGLQLLFAASAESPDATGLGVVPGTVVRFGTGRRVPHVGWSQTRVAGDSPLFFGIDGDAFFYYVHSYYVVPDDAAAVAATAEYGDVFCSAVSRDNVHAVQFHPEKSQDAGLALLENFLNRC